MHSIEPDEPIVESRRAWEPPAITKLAIGSETKSTGANRQGARSDTAGQDVVAPPQPPAEPQSKLGFSFEMAFPLSARMGR